MEKYAVSSSDPVELLAQQMVKEGKLNETQARFASLKEIDNGKLVELQSGKDPGCPP